MSEVVSFENLTNFLKGASLHEVYRVSAALFNELENPKRIAAVKRSIKVGTVVEFFDGQTNLTHKGEVVSKDIKYVSLRQSDTRELWKIPYHMLVIDARDFDFSSKEKGLNKNQIKIGDIVGFNNEGEQITGAVTRLNQKTVSLKTNTNQKWRVSYSLLYSIIEGEHREGKEELTIEYNTNK